MAVKKDASNQERPVDERLVDDEAEDDDDEVEEPSDNHRSRKKKFEDSSEEEEDDDQDAFENDGFIVGEGDEDEEDEDDDADLGYRRVSAQPSSPRRKKKRRRDIEDDDDELAEGDLLLLEEQGLSVKNRRKLTRLRKATADDDDEHEFRRELSELRDEYKYNEDEVDERDAVDENVDDDDEFDDFIDDGGRRRRRKKKRDAGSNSEAVRAARSIFGDYEDLEEAYGPVGGRVSGKVKDNLGDDDDADSTSPDVNPTDNEDHKNRGSSGRSPFGRSRGQDEEEDDDLGLENSHKAPEEDRLNGSVRSGRGPSSQNKIADDDILEDPLLDGTMAAAARLSLGAAACLSPADNLIVDTDIPEYLQEHFGARVHADADEIAREAAWIYGKAFGPDPVFANRFNPEEVVKKIGIVLTYMYSEKLDIPFIAMYRKDYISPELMHACGGDPAEEAVSLQLPPIPFAPVSQAMLARPKGFNSEKFDDFDENLSIDHLRGVAPGYDDGFGDWSSLWTIVDWDKKWTEVLLRRESLMSMIKASSEKGVSAVLIDHAVSIVKICEDEVELSDVENYVRLACDAGLAAKVLGERDRVFEEPENDLSRLPERRRPQSRANKYSEYCRKGYGRLAEKFGINSSQFADNVEGALQYGQSYQLHVPRDAEGTPLDMSSFVGQDLVDEAKIYSDAAAGAGRFVGTDALIETNAERLLDAARYIIRQEICADPRIRKVARKVLIIETAMVSTKPTSRGMSEVDSSHHLRPIMTLKDKPIRAFSGSTDFAKIRKAEAKSYLTTTIRFPPEQVTQLSGYLQSAGIVSVTGNSPLIEQWNAERSKLAEEILNDLVSQMTREAEEFLQKSTDQCLRHRLMDAASRRLIQGPIRPYIGEDGSPKVMAICVTNEEDEDADPAQAHRDMEEAKVAPGTRPYQRPKGARITFVNLDVNGEFVSSDEVFGFWLRRPLVQTSPPPEIAKRIKAYLTRLKPQVIVVGLGSGGKDAVRLHADLCEIVKGMIHERNATFIIGEDASKEGATSEQARERLVANHIISLSEDVARMYCLTSAADVALPIDGMTLIEKRAIAIGRLAQEPLSVYAGIGVERDIAARLELHPLHYMADIQSRVEALRRALIRAVCCIGVDVNRILIIPHLQPMMSFVGGLGIRKASELIIRLEKYVNDEANDHHYLPSRKHLYVNQFMGRIVFLSSAGFLRVRDPALHPGGSTVDAVRDRRARLERKSRGRRREENADAESPLDDSRIHPENYAVALKIADEALRDENGKLRVNLSESSGLSETSRIIAAVLDNPDGLSQLDLEQYANHLENLGRGRLYETIKMIASEFQSPFKDRRAVLTSPHPRAQFYIAIRADPADLRVGSEVTATSCHVGKNSAITCRLPYSLNGIIFKSDFSDEILDDEALRELVSEGSDIPCRILDFKFDRFQVQLTSRPSVLANPKLIPGYHMTYDITDEYVIEYPVNRGSVGGLTGETVSRLQTTASSALISDEARLRARSAALRSRAKEVVTHDFFRDIDGNAAVDAMRNAGPGEVIIRPSGKGKDQFVFTAKFAEASALNKDATRGIIHIMCEVQNPLSRTGDTRYVVGDEPYSSVDEVLERFVLPVVTNMGEALRNRKFVPLQESDIVRTVKDAKKEAPNSIPYFFGLADQKPLYLALIYIPGTRTVQNEYIKVVPDGYQFRNVLHATLDLLTMWFKKNMRSADRPRAESVRATTAASPYISSEPSTKPPAVPFISASVAPSPFIDEIAQPLADDAPPEIPMEIPSSGVRPSADGEAMGGQVGDRAFGTVGGILYHGADRSIGTASDSHEPRLLTQDPPPPLPPQYNEPLSGVPSFTGAEDGYGGHGEFPNTYANRYADSFPPPIQRVPQADEFNWQERWSHPPPRHGTMHGPGFESTGGASAGGPPTGRNSMPRNPAHPVPGGRGRGIPPHRPIDEAQARRGQMPVPAWKKAQQEAPHGP